jgi:hypothetical protein
MFATSFLSAHMLFLFHLSNSLRIDYDVKFAFCRIIVGLACFDRDFTLHMVGCGASKSFQRSDEEIRVRISA